MFKVGDKVRVRKDLDCNEKYGKFSVVEEMKKYAGEETTVNAISYGGYKLEIDGSEWLWSEEMLEKVEMGGNDMTAKEYLEARSRMLKSSKIGRCNRDCESCPFEANNNGEELDCGRFEAVHLEKAIEIVQKWGEEHPVKTLKDKLLEKFPNAQLRDDGTPAACAQDLGLITAEECEEISCVECWNRPYVDEFEEWLNA